jgi:hypothetical protein
MHFFEGRTDKSTVFLEYQSGYVHVIRMVTMLWTKLGRTSTDSKWLYMGVCTQRGRKGPGGDLLCA